MSESDGCESMMELLVESAEFFDPELGSWQVRWDDLGTVEDI